MIHKYITSLFLILQTATSWAQVSASYTVSSNSVCSGNESLIVLSANEIPILSGLNVEHLSLLRILENKQYSVVFQIDQKDTEGRYILNDPIRNASVGENYFGTLDELVFRRNESGQRLNASSENTHKELLRKYSLIEVEILSNDNKDSSWVYIVIDDKVASKSQPDYSYPLAYVQEDDSIISPIYKISFSKEKPFLVDAFHWHLSNIDSLNNDLLSETQWTQNLTDTMKIRHTGLFFGFPFKRTDDDYFSQLIAVKDGPLRVIRRTENKVKVLWKLKSPALYIDYVMMPDGFVMDSMIDIPFKISFFFSQLETITTMDWNPEFSEKKWFVNTRKMIDKLPLTGYPSEAQEVFNKIKASSFSLASDYGFFQVELSIPDDFLIQSQLYLKDDLSEVDLPENIPGQFANVGFKTTGWEGIDTELHHLKFTVCMDKKIPSI